MQSCLFDTLGISFRWNLSMNEISMNTKVGTSTSNNLDISWISKIFILKAHSSLERNTKEWMLKWCNYVNCWIPTCLSVAMWQILLHKICRNSTFFTSFVCFCAKPPQRACARDLPRNRKGTREGRSRGHSAGESSQEKVSKEIRAGQRGDQSTEVRKATAKTCWPTDAGLSNARG